MLSQEPNCLFPELFFFPESMRNVQEFTNNKKVADRIQAALQNMEIYQLRKAIKMLPCQRDRAQ